ncbi:MAG: DUF3429 domain-containing protein [Thioalkalivibrionaceae bacterium]
MKNAPTTNAETLVWQRRLGYAGLIPFWFLALVIAWFEITTAVNTSPNVSDAAVTGVVVYGAVIVSFMAAIHWGLALVHEHWRPARLPGPLFAVIPALLAWVLAAWAPASIAAAGMALLLGAIWIVERQTNAVSLWGRGYARLRSHLTIGATSALLLVALSLAATSR